MTLDILMEVVGWIGAILILAGYGLLSAGKLNAKSPTYQWLNVVGAIGFIANIELERRLALGRAQRHLGRHRRRRAGQDLRAPRKGPRLNLTKAR